MAVSYYLVKKANPKDKEQPKKFYAMAEVSGDYSTDKLCAEIEKMSSLTEGDVMAAVSAMLHCVGKALQEGKSVSLGDLGRMRVSVSSEGTLTEDEFTASKIKKARVIFVPGKKLKLAVQECQFRKVGAEAKKPTEETEQANA